MGSDAGDTHCIKLYEKGGEALIHEPGNLLNSSKVKNFRAKVLYLEFVCQSSEPEHYRIMRLIKRQGEENFPRK